MKNSIPDDFQSESKHTNHKEHAGCVYEHTNEFLVMPWVPKKMSQYEYSNVPKPSHFKFQMFLS